MCVPAGVGDGGGGWVSAVMDKGEQVYMGQTDLTGIGDMSSGWV